MVQLILVGILILAIKVESQSPNNCTSFSVTNQVNSNVTETVNNEFSSAPNNLPIRRIYVHGRPIYVKQVLVEPERSSSRLKREGSMLSQSSDDLYCFTTSHMKKVKATIRHKRCGFPQAAAPAAAAAPTYTAAAYPAPAQSYSGYPSPAYQQPQYGEQSQYQQSNYYYQPQPQQQFYSPQPQAAQVVYVPAVQQQQPVPQAPLPAPAPPPPPPPSLPAPAPPPSTPVGASYAQLPPPPATPPAQLVPPQPLPPIAEQPQYPLPECYTDDSNFMCCNKQLEELMKSAYNGLVGSTYNFNRCNVQKMANTIQKAAEERFNTTFEVLAGGGDFASKSHFYDNYICKIEMEGRFLLAYASPKPEEPTSPEDSGVVGPMPQTPQYRTPNNHMHKWRR
ncbi:ground-like domain-containing protein [Ditylenchus destructor]|nr:ground-like domain-containing protein [Ditylenchus destructor]